MVLDVNNLIGQNPSRPWRDAEAGNTANIAGFYFVDMLKIFMLVCISYGSFLEVINKQSVFFSAFFCCF